MINKYNIKINSDDYTSNQMIIKKSDDTNKMSMKRIKDNKSEMKIIKLE